jgi:hypothetical protein
MSKARKTDNRLNLYLSPLNFQFIKEDSENKGISMSGYTNILISEVRKRFI